MKGKLIMVVIAFATIVCCKPTTKESEAVNSEEMATDVKQATDKSSVKGLTGLTGLNDASRIIKCGSKYFWYSTGGGIKMRWISDPLSGNWNIGPDVFPERPSFWANFSPINIAWAPDIIYDDKSGEYRMYYCVSSLGSTKSAIALAINSTLDPDAADYAWVDKGIVIATEADNSFNALDPCPVLGHDNEWYLCFGSHFSGIKLLRLGADGLRHETDTQIWDLARKNPDAVSSAIEAGAIYPGVKNGENGYWLYVNWGSGLGKKEKATYQVRIGWSTAIQGPYLDKEGVSLYNGGGSVFMTTEKLFTWDNSTRIGRGHVGIIRGENLDGKYPDWVSYSYWLKSNKDVEGGKRFGIQRLITDADGWPDAGSLFQN